MIIKKYLAKSEVEAIEMAKEDLGNNAIVMNIKKVHPKGLAKLFVKAKVEVTAALDETPSYEEVKKEPKVQESEPKSEPVASMKMPEESSLEERLTKLQSLLEMQMKEQEVVLDAKEKKEELAEVEDKEEKQTTQKGEEEENEKTIACKELIFKQLVQNEVDEEIAKTIMEEANKTLPLNPSLDQILASVYQRIILMLGQPYLIDTKKKDKTKFIFFLGSTGVGKTTTIAKIASKLKLEEDAKIVLVTADTYRIAAVEQLKTYANILSVPLKVVYSPKDLGDMLEELNEYDICLVDTAGCSHKNKEQINDVRDLLEQVPISDRQVYLVLNAGTKYSDLKEITSVYSGLTDFSLVFTKLDETSSAGVMLNMKMKTKCPLSYVTWGQNVPDDIGEVNTQEVVKQLLGGKKQK